MEIILGRTGSGKSTLAAERVSALIDAELKNKISTLVKEKHSDYNCVITIDKSYAPVTKN